MTQGFGVDGCTTARRQERSQVLDAPGRTAHGVVQRIVRVDLCVSAGHRP
ncbi:hypothetical protein AZ22_1621 [Bordetella bronchiseptica 980-2]|nr:hypothetical protein AZ22_1621 [Bordetella bronchiseptica 980-2]